MAHLQSNATPLVLCAATGADALVGTLASGRVYWLPYHTSPRHCLPQFQPCPQPIVLVTPHTQAALALVPHCPQLRMICAPDVAVTQLEALLLLLPHLRGGPLVIPARARAHQRKRAA